MPTAPAPHGWRGRPRPANHSQRYGAAHRAERARRIAQLRARPGSLTCPRCGTPVTADMDLHLDHDDTDPTGRTYLPGMTCAACNIRAGSHRAHRRRHGTRQTAPAASTPPAAHLPDRPPCARCTCVLAGGVSVNCW